jgi:regulatory protein YycI of two-component signal transduction system YycFG
MKKFIRRYIFKEPAFRTWWDFVFILIVLFLSWAYWHDTQAYKEVYENPCQYCGECQLRSEGITLVNITLEETNGRHIPTHSGQAFQKNHARI